jgi:hypothetical protein
MFGDIETDIQTRIPDRPKRPVPDKISDMPEIPWLASNYVPQANSRPTTKSIIARLIKTAIPVVGTIAVLGIIAVGAATLFSFYS